MRSTPLIVKEQIRQMLQENRLYREIAKELNLSERVTRKWGQVIKKGLPMEPPMGRPKSGVLGAFAPQIHAAINSLRPGKEGWGAITIHAELRRDVQLSAYRVPSVRSINTYLKSTHKSRFYEKKEHLPQEPVLYATHPHDVWQMDSEGNKVVPGVGSISAINIKDTFSKTYVASYPCALRGNFNHPNKGDYQWALRLGMLEFGRCCRLQVDHESIYYENTNKTPYPTPFHLWVLSLGITLSFTPKAKPYHQGAVEREHQTVHHQTCSGRTHENWAAFFAFCQQRRHALNHYIPCRMLEGKAPFQSSPEAVHSGKPYDPKQEEEYFNPDPIYDYLSQCRWVRTITAQRTFSLGAQSYHLKKATPNTSVVITFDRSPKTFHCKNAQGETIGHLQPKGISFKELSGSLDDFITWATQCPDVEYPSSSQT